MFKNICLSTLLLLFCFLLTKTCFGSTDETFVANAATEVEARAFPQFVTNDGKMIVIGQFNRVNGVIRNGIVRLNQDGSIDPTFSVDTGNSFLASGFPNNIRVAVAQADGKILIGGSFAVVNGVSRYALARLNQDGTLDTSFAPNIQQDNNNSITTIMPLPNGKILAGGFSVNINGTTRSLVRLNSDGSLDSTFNNSFSARMDKIVLQSDGKILLAAPGLGRIARLTVDGVIDSTFVSTNPSGNITDIVVQPDGKIIISGSFDRVNNINRNNIARLNADGTLDTTLSFPALNMGCCRGTVVNALLLQADGKILIGGVFDTINGVSQADVARLNSDGTLDTSFVPNVRSISPSGDGYEINSLVLSPDGKVIIGGYFPKIENSFRSNIAKLNIADGSLDNTFDPLIGRNSSVNLVKTQSDGKILVGGNFTLINNKRVKFIARLNSNGDIDESFNPDYQAITGVTTIELDSDNKILVGGSFTNPTNNTLNSIARLNSNGVIDTSFSVVANGAVTAIHRQSDNKILIGGNFNRVNNTNRFSFARLNSTGTLDTSMPSVSFFNGSSPGTTIKKIVVQTDGKILVGGQFQQVNSISKIGLARINTDGSLDTSFSTDLNASSSTDVIVNDVVILPSGKILAAGSLGTINGGARRFAQFNQDGSNDPTFTSNIPFLLIPYKILIQNNGKILIGGFVNSLVTRRVIIRLNIDGSLDETLRIGTGANSSVYSLDQIANNTLIVVGEFTEFNGSTHIGIAKIISDGNSKFDYDGDGKSDVSVFRPSNGAWYLNRSTAGFTGFGFGQQGDLITPADYDGDGKTDVAVFRAGDWYRLNSGNGQFVAAQFGSAGDLPVAGDYDADGKADLAVFRASNGTWYRINSSNGQFVAVQFGAMGDKPQVADFDGDGKTDLAVFRPSVGGWYYLRSSDGAFVGTGFGQAGDIATAADYDGDGKADLSVFRPSNGTWYRINSGSNQFVAVQFGTSADIPAPADYDGDGKADIAVFRPSNGTWYQLRSTAGFIGQQFGVNGDIPTASAFGQ